MFAAVTEPPGSIPLDVSAARSASRWHWPWAFAGFLLLLGAWAVAAPYSGFPDERDHILRAYGVVTGQVALVPVDAANGGGAFVDVPRSLVVEQCWQFHSEVPASCAREPGGDETVERAATAAGRYFPVYYALVGAPLAFWPDWTGVLLARLLSVALCAFLLANALTDAMRWSRHRLLAAGVLVAATPMVAHMGGALNPSGPELAAGVAFFAAAIPLLFNPAARRNPTLLWHVGIAALLLATLRLLGPLWLALSVLALLLPWRRATLADLWGWRALRGWLIGVGAATAAAVAWAMTSNVTESNPYFRESAGLGPLQIAWTEVQRWPDYIAEMVGVMSWLDAQLPGLVYIVWPVVAGAVVIWGYLFGDRSSRLRLVALGIAGTLVPLAISVVYANTFGFITQGRYLLPVLVGLPMLGAFLIGEYGLPADVSRTLTRLCIVVLMPIHVVALAFTMIRWQHGQVRGAGLNPLAGPWHPVLGSVTPLLAAVVGLAVVAWLAWAGGPRNAAPNGTRPAATATATDSPPAPDPVTT